MSTTGYELIIQNVIKHDKMVSCGERKMSTRGCELIKKNLI